MAQPVIRVFADLESLSREAAEQFVRLAQQQAQAGCRFSIALAGGSTPRRLYELLAGEPYRSRVPWASVHAFWGDERWVPPDHPDSNFRQAFSLLLTHVPLPAGNIYRVPTGSGDATLAAATYERTLRTFFKLQDGAWPAFDLVVLGLGEDGHVASLFPQSAALQEAHHAVTATTGGNPNVPRVTLTLPVLNHAKHLVWLVAGAQKASVARDVLEGADRAEELPAQRVRPTHGEAMWLLDRAAAGLLHVDEAAKGNA
ncbi:MAG: 6-phosphogluconolactonase [Candidatus Omnitrophica bacterium CG11_big_fil_rev_8_21_14_0_20_63_9]|nr:MAG: 6-phosphogluconolactonase [Candidatus Omnitrophica bacterium CG11_big_fil_rev_8_21_14_0_20_63_9]